MNEDIVNRATHQVRDRSHCCSICSKKFYSKASLIIHEKGHSGNRPHVCEVCTKTFVTLSGLISHKRVQGSQKWMRTLWYVTLWYAECGSGSIGRGSGAMWPRQCLWWWDGERTIYKHKFDLIWGTEVDPQQERHWQLELYGTQHQEENAWTMST